VTAHRARRTRTGPGLRRSSRVQGQKSAPVRREVSTSSWLAQWHFPAILATSGHDAEVTVPMTPAGGGLTVAGRSSGAPRGSWQAARTSESRPVVGWIRGDGSGELDWGSRASDRCVGTRDGSVPRDEPGPAGRLVHAEGGDGRGDTRRCRCDCGRHTCPELQARAVAADPVSPYRCGHDEGRHGRRRVVRRDTYAARHVRRTTSPSGCTRSRRSPACR
jgi:hypothetical protein